MPYFKNPTIKAIIERYRTLASIDHARALMGWDLEVYMPEEGVKERGIATAQLSLLHQKLLLDKGLASLVAKASKAKGLNDYEKGTIRVLSKKIDQKRKIPPKLVEREAIAQQQGQVAWRNARAKADFTLFEPYLEKLVGIAQEKADKLGYKTHPYDAMVDYYEEGMTTRELESIFPPFIMNSKKLLKRIMAGDNGFTKAQRLEKLAYKKEDVQRVNEALLRAFKYDPKRFRMDVSTHPFTEVIGSNDVRMTTRYEGTDLKRSVFSTVHEGGHVLYELLIDQNLSMTPIAGGISTGVHEALSRVWENNIGRSMAFVKGITPLMKKDLGFLRNYAAEELFYYFNTVKPGFIRVDADEVTYNFHIALRYELEKMLMGREIKTKDLPDIWNDKMEEYLGIRPKNDALGVLQDVHWSMCAIGYFPAYSLGNMAAAMMMEHARKSIKDLDSQLEHRNFAPIQKWLGEKICRYGSTYAPKDLLKRAFGEGYNPDYLIRYLESKYLE